MGNIVSCLTPRAGATADDCILVQEPGGNVQGGYRFGTQAPNRPLQIIPPAPAAPLNNESSTPTTTTTTATSNRDRVNNGGPFGEVQQPVQQQQQQAAVDQGDYANREEDGLFDGADVEPSAPFSWQRGRQIGQGAFGTVYMALVHATGQEIAVKQVSLPRDAASNGKVSSHIRSLEREVAVLRTLRHENIVRYLGTERTDEHLNIFLEYVAGGPISNKLAQFGPLREETIRVYTKQILRGLEYLHQQKVMHRDIKGANILVDTNGVVKLADFGASKKIENLATIGGGARSLHGTAHWMAPEVIKQLGHGRAADIWSLACVVIEMATGQPPWAKFRDPLSVMFHVASTKDMPALPEHLSAHARDFLTLCFNRVPHERPNATRLLAHPWLHGVVVPRSNRPPPTLLPIPGPNAPLPPPNQQQQQQQQLLQVQPQLPSQQQQHQAVPAGMHLHPQQVPPSPGLRSPPSPIKEESDSRYGSPAAPTAGSSTPTTSTARVAMLNAAAAGSSGTGMPMPFGLQHGGASGGGRPAVPPLPLEAMKMGTLAAQSAAAAQQASSTASNVAAVGATASTAAGGLSAATPPKPPLAPSPQVLAPQAGVKPSPAPAPQQQPQQQQYDTISDPETVRLQLLSLQQQQQQAQQQQQQRHRQDAPATTATMAANAYDSICMGVGMTMSVSEPPPPPARGSSGGAAGPSGFVPPQAGAPYGAPYGGISTMTLSGYNPIEEPSWMPGQTVLNQAILAQLAAVSEHSTPQSPDASSAGADAADATTTTAAGAAAAGPANTPSRSATDVTSAPSSGDGGSGPDAPPSSTQPATDTTRMPPPPVLPSMALPPVPSPAMAQPTVAQPPLLDMSAIALSPRSGALTHRSGAGTQRSGAGTYRGTARAGIKLDVGTSGKPVVVPARPALAGLFAAAYEEDGDTQTEPDQPSPASKPVASATAAFSPNSTIKTLSRQSTAPHSARNRASTSRRVLEDAAGSLAGTLDPARAKQWRDELVAELDAERMRAVGGAKAAQHQRESVVTAVSAT